MPKDEATALHTAARRYCQESFSEWAGIYEKLQREESWRVERPFQSGWDYSDEAYRTFPRYRLAKNTQIEIERLVVDSGATLDETRMRLVAASDVAHASLRNELTNKSAREALREEAADFVMQQGTPILQKKEQKSARKNHSYALAARFRR